MANIKPTQNFVLVQFVSKDGNPNPIILPDGAKDPDSKIIVLAVGPDVRATPSPIGPGVFVLLRGDTKHFEAGPGSEQLQIALVDHRSIIAVVEDDEVVPMTDEQIEAIRLG